VPVRPRPKRCVPLSLRLAEARTRRQRARGTFMHGEGVCLGPVSERDRGYLA
jgi:hypothetical protein